MYLCRTLSYKGAEFEIVDASLDDKMTVWPTNFFGNIDGYSLLVLSV